MEMMPFCWQTKISDAKPYNEIYTDVTWATCTLRTWLNDTFLNTAFTSAEQAAIKDTTVVNSDNPKYGTGGGKNTTDKVYLLSIAEASSGAYGFNGEFNASTDETREAKNTAYAKECGAWTGFVGSKYEGNGEWWLRSPGMYGRCASVVTSYGYINVGGSDGNTDINAVRPGFAFKSFPLLLFGVMQEKLPRKGKVVHHRKHQSLLRQNRR